MSLEPAIRVTAWIVAALWVGKALETAVGLRRVPNLLGRLPDVVPAGKPTLAVVVPARNEAEHLGACIRSLLAQDYERIHIVAVDDRSDDGTGALLDTLAQGQGTEGRLSVVHVTELPEGWLGKTHAMAMGARQAIAEMQPEYLLFTDADVMFSPEAVRLALAQAVTTGADHFVLAPTPILRTAGEAMMLGFLQVMGLWAARLWKVEDAKARDAIGIGAFNLLRTEAYVALGGFEELRMQILEDLTLARKVKRAGMRQGIALGPGMVRLHWATGAMGVVRVMTKNLFAVFGFRVWAVLAACMMFGVFCLGPIAGLFYSATRVPAVLAMAAITWLYGTARRVGGIPAWIVVGFPVAACLFVFSMLRSMVVTLRDGGVTWRGTFYRLGELRKNVQNLR